MHEVTEELYREYYKYNRREKYQKEQDAAHNVYHYSDLDTDEILGGRLLSIHNIHFLHRLTAKIKEAIWQDRLLDFRNEMMENYRVK